MLLQIFEFIALLLGIAYLVHHYSDKEVKLHIKILSFIAWLLSFGFVFLVPLDIYITLEKQNLLDECTGSNAHSNKEICQGFDGVTTDNFETMVQVWRTVYWVTFVFTWVILPFFQDYEAAGEFDTMGKVKRSIKVNLMIMLGIAAAGLVFIIYLVASGKISWDNLEGFLIGLANGFGIFLVVILLGHGLVMIPKKSWRERNEDTVLKYCYFRATSIDDAKINKRFALEDKVRLLLFAQSKHTEFEVYFQKIIDLVPSDITKHCRDVKSVSEQIRKELSDLGQMNMDKLATLNKDTKQLVYQLQREQARWDAILDDSFFSQDLINNKQSSDRTINSEFAVPRSSRIGQYLDNLQWLWNCQVKSIFKLSMTVIFITFSLFVLLGEISIFSGSAINPFSYILDDDQNHIIGTQVLVFLPLLYISFCVYYGMFQIKIAGFFGLYKYHQTDAPSLMFFSINFARVTAPISYNYLKIIGVKNSAFVKILGSMDDVPLLGSANTYFFPMILIMLILFNVFDVYSKILSSLGLKQFEFSDSFDDDRIDQGRVLITRARDSWAKEFKKLKASSISHQFEGYNTASSLREHLQASNFGRGYASNDGGSGNTSSDPELRLSTSISSSSRGNHMNKQVSTKFQNFSNFEEILSI